MPECGAGLVAGFMPGSHAGMGIFTSGHKRSRQHKLAEVRAGLSAQPANVQLAFSGAHYGSNANT